MNVWVVQYSASVYSASIYSASLNSVSLYSASIDSARDYKTTRLAVAMSTIIKTCGGLRPPHPQVNTPLNRGPAAPGPLLNTPQTFKTLKTIFIVMATAAYLLTRYYIILVECILAEYCTTPKIVRLEHYTVK